ncbi:MAG: DHCW motif cupin fold protein [Deltaproteobacteria bacterium]|nr:DHCW motif cupin fold protein [Deltaproteobacteria bacterium]
MEIRDVPFQTTDWSQVPSTSHPGETGTATWRTITAGNVRVRLVEYSAGYLADHWCERGHIVLVLAGQLVTELRDGRCVTLLPTQSYQVSDGEAHRSASSSGARLFVVD